VSPLRGRTRAARKPLAANSSTAATAGFDRQAAEVAAPGDPRSAHVAFERCAKARAVEPGPRADRADRLRPCTLKSSATSPTVRPRGTSNVERAPRIFDRILRDPSDRGTQSDHRCRNSPVAQRAAEIAAVGERDHAGRPAATADPPLLPPQVRGKIVRVARRAEYGVEGLRAGAELGTLVLPTAIAPALRCRSTVMLIGGRNEVCETAANRRSCASRASRRCPCAQREVRARVRAHHRAACACVGRARGRERPFRRPRHDRVERGIDRRDALEVGAHHLGCRNGFWRRSAAFSSAASRKQRSSRRSLGVLARRGCGLRAVNAAGRRDLSRRPARRALR